MTEYPDEEEKFRRMYTALPKPLECLERQGILKYVRHLGRLPMSFLVILVRNRGLVTLLD